MFKLAAALALAPFALGQTWDTQNRTYDRDEAHLMSIFAHEAYCPTRPNCPHGTGPPRMPAGWTLLGEYGGGLGGGNDHAFIAREDTSPGRCVAAFRGSTQLADWISNVNFIWGDFNENFSRNGDLMTWTHRGFQNGYENVAEPSRTSTFLEDVKDCLGQNNKLVITGHSRGGSLASHMGIQFGLDKTLDDGNFSGSRFRQTSSPDLVVYTYGEPRTVSRGYDDNQWPAVHNIRKFRFIYGEDLVSATPPNLGVTPFHHTGASYLIEQGPIFTTINQVEYDWPYSRGETGSTRDHDIDNYVDALSMTLN